MQQGQLIGQSTSVSLTEKIVPNEYKECKWFYEWACAYNPLLREYLIKNVNEGQRSSMMGKLLKLIGMRPGIPDYQLPLPNANWRGLWIEMKKTDQERRKKDDKQNEWIYKLKKIRQYATYAYGWEHASKIVVDYLNDRI
jgi:hypothetical protein